MGDIGSLNVEKWPVFPYIATCERQFTLQEEFDESGKDCCD